MLGCTLYTVQACNCTARHLIPSKHPLIPPQFVATAAFSMSRSVLPVQNNEQQLAGLPQECLPFSYGDAGVQGKGWALFGPEADMERVSVAFNNCAEIMADRTWLDLVRVPQSETAFGLYVHQRLRLCYMYTMHNSNTYTFRAGPPLQ